MQNEESIRNLYFLKVPAGGSIDRSCCMNTVI